MGVAAALGAAASAASLGSSISGLVGGGGGGAGGFGPNGVPLGYQLTGQGPADTQFQDYLKSYGGAASNLPGQVLGPAATAFGNIQNNPGAAGALGTANTISGMGPGIANQQFGAAGQLYGAGNQIIQQGMDPQQQLYQQLQQQTQDRANATNAMYGLGSSPYGAGVANKSLNDFNIEWQNQQLQRQIQASQGAGRAYSGASDLAGLGLGTLQSTGMLPYQTYLGQQNDIFSGISGLTGATQNAFGPTQQLFGDLSSYLSLGQGGTGLAQAGQQQAFSQGQQLQTNLGGALAGLGNNLSQLFGPSSGGTIGPSYTGGTNLDGSLNTPGGLAVGGGDQSFYDPVAADFSFGGY